MCLSEMEVAAHAGATRGQCEHVTGQPCNILRSRLRFHTGSQHTQKKEHQRAGQWCACSSSSVAHSCPTLQPHGLQHARPPWPSPAPRACSNSCPLSRGCHPAISSCCALLLPSIFPSTRVFSSESVDTQESSPTLQVKSINSSVLSFLFIVQLSHPYMTTGKP